MATRIIEYCAPARRDGYPVVPAGRKIVAQSALTATGTSQQSAAFARNASMVCVQSDEAVYVAFAASPTATTSDYRLHQQAVTKILLPNKWEPRDYQTPLWRYMHGGGKRAVAIWPRRHGKDDVALHFTACAAHERVGPYWHLLPQQNQARKAIWDAVDPHTGRRRSTGRFRKS
jgi:hypothetical protein